MTRRKKIYRDKEYKRYLRREKIREYVTYAFVVAVIIDLCVMGFNQTKDKATGWGLIVLALLCAGYVVFDLITRLYGWKILTGLDTEKFKARDILPEDIYYERFEKVKFGRNLIVFLSSVMAVTMIVAGIQEKYRWFPDETICHTGTHGESSQSERSFDRYFRLAEHVRLMNFSSFFLYGKRMSYDILSVSINLSTR